MRIAVGMSGGVDSTMAAALLLEQGHEVIGLTMSLWNEAYPVPDHGRGCYGPGEHRVLQRAQAAAKQLGIPHHVVRLSHEFCSEVLEKARTEYRAGLTPNPCVACNNKIKFDALLTQAERMGVSFDLFATGHYARLDREAETGRPRLKRAVDATKDQSYFLCRLTLEQLKRIMFPLGSINKQDTRRLAAALGFSDLTEYPESQDFLQNGDYTVLFSGETQQTGPIEHVDGYVLGRHRGLAFYTVGQRRALGISGTKEPLYVVRLDVERQAVIVGPRKALEARQLKIGALNWLASDKPPSAPFMAEVRIRQQHQPALAVVSVAQLEGKRVAEVIFDEPQWAVAPGQTAAIYEGEDVLGGGVIIRS